VTTERIISGSPVLVKAHFGGKLRFVPDWLKLPPLRLRYISLRPGRQLQPLHRVVCWIAASPLPVSSPDRNLRPALGKGSGQCIRSPVFAAEVVLKVDFCSVRILKALFGFESKAQQIA